MLKAQLILPALFVLSGCDDSESRDQHLDNVLIPIVMADVNSCMNLVAALREGDVVLAEVIALKDLHKVDYLLNGVLYRDDLSNEQIEAIRSFVEHNPVATINALEPEPISDRLCFGSAARKEEIDEIISVYVTTTGIAKIRIVEALRSGNVDVAERMSIMLLKSDIRIIEGNRGQVEIDDSVVSAAQEVVEDSDRSEEALKRSEGEASTARRKPVILMP